MEFSPISVPLMIKQFVRRTMSHFKNVILAYLYHISLKLVLYLAVVYVYMTSIAVTIRSRTPYALRISISLPGCQQTIILDININL